MKTSNEKCVAGNSTSTLKSVLYGAVNRFKHYLTNGLRLKTYKPHKDLTLKLHSPHEPEVSGDNGIGNLYHLPLFTSGSPSYSPLGLGEREERESCPLFSLPPRPFYLPLGDGTCNEWEVKE